MYYKYNPKTDFKDIDKPGKDEVKQQIDELGEGIEFHNKKYYAKNAPVISDKTYDKLFKRLQYQEKVKHSAPMFSLNAVMEEDELNDFFDRVHRKTKDSKLEFILEPKFDGVSVEFIMKTAGLSRVLSGATGVKEKISRIILN